jgi:hypothetical protein
MSDFPPSENLSMLSPSPSQKNGLLGFTVGIPSGVITVPPNLSATLAKLEEKIAKLRDDFRAHKISNETWKRNLEVQLAPLRRAALRVFLNAWLAEKGYNPLTSSVDRSQPQSSGTSHLLNPD